MNTANSSRVNAAQATGTTGSDTDKTKAKPARRRLITIRPWQRKWIWWMVYLCIGSGVGLFYLKFFVEKDFFSIWIHPTHPWLIAIHLITSPILIFVIGGLMIFHVIPHFRERDHFWTGNLAMATFLIYSISGMFLFFLFPEEVINWTKWIHTISGFVFFPIIGYHWYTRYLRKPGGSFEAMVDGQAPLWRIFWIWGIAGGVVLGVIYVLLAPFGAGAAASWAAVETTWAVLVLIGIWRCAPNATRKLWGHLARLSVIVAIAGMAWHLVEVAHVVATIPATVSTQDEDGAFVEDEEAFMDEAFMEDEEAFMDEAFMEDEEATFEADDESFMEENHLFGEEREEDQQ